MCFQFNTKALLHSTKDESLTCLKFSFKVLSVKRQWTLISFAESSTLA